jgi:hypothetical protein
VLGGKQTAAAYLLGKGDLLYQNGAQLHRLQSLFATTIHLNYELRIKNYEFMIQHSTFSIRNFIADLQLNP